MSDNFTIPDDPRERNAIVRVAVTYSETESVHSSLRRSALGGSSHRFILVVDDDAAIRSTVSEILELEGFTVETAANGRDALNTIHVRIPKLIILDMRMPVMDGWAFARILKAEGVYVPILVMTAAQNARRWAEEIGADAFIPKPFDLEELLRAVNTFMSSGGPAD